MTSFWEPIWITLHMAFWSVGILLVLGTPLAWWLSRSEFKGKVFIEAFCALPLILPPTVLGFYLLLAFGPEGKIGQLWTMMTGRPLAFSFPGLVFGSVIYSLPFVVQPLQRSFEKMGKGPLEVAETLGAGPCDRIFSVIIPLNRQGFLTAMALGFAHTIGEFGVVLMIGGNIPGRTQVLSLSLYELVETMDYQKAHIYSFGLLLFSFCLLSLVYKGFGLRGTEG